MVNTFFRSTWDLIITTTAKFNSQSHSALKLKIAKQIVKTAKSNVRDGPSIINSDDDLIVVAGGVQGT